MLWLIMMEDAKQEVIGGLQRTKSVGRRRPQNKQEEMEFYTRHWQPPNNGKNQNQSTNHDTTPSPYHLSLFIKLHTRSYAIFS